MVNSDTRLVAILGCPVRHSLSPLIHNTSFQRQGVNMRYVALEIAPADLPAAVGGLAAMGFLGANVTIPHKEAVLAHLDTLSEAATAAGAVNTIVCRSGRLHGDNTDIAGFLAPLSKYDLHGTSMVILGAGGAARAVAYGLLKTYAPGNLVLAARRVQQAEALAADLAPHDTVGALKSVHIGRVGKDVRTARLIVNTTPVGMHPAVEATPWPNAADFKPDQVVYDLVYRPLMTRFLKDAAISGATVIGGLEMFVHQAAAAYAQWTGTSMDVMAARRALVDVLG